MAVRAAALRTLMEQARPTAREYDVRYVCEVVETEEERWTATCRVTSVS